MLDHHALHTGVVVNQRKRARLVVNGNPLLFRGALLGIHQPRTTAPRLDGEPAPELEAAVDLECLASVDGHEAQTVGPQPHERRLAAAHQQFHEIGIGAVLRDARHVVEELVFRIRTEVGARDFLIRQVGHQRTEIVHAVVREADGTRGEPGVAAGLVLGRAFQDDHVHTRFARRERGAHRSVARTHHDDVTTLRQHRISDIIGLVATL